jgi:hypothetical protein
MKERTKGGWGIKIRKKSFSLNFNGHFTLAKGRMNLHECLCYSWLNLKAIAVSRPPDGIRVRPSGNCVKRRREKKQWRIWKIRLDDKCDVCDKCNAPRYPQTFWYWPQTEMARGLQPVLSWTLKDWGRRFEFRSSHGWMSTFSCSVLYLRWADPPPKESY